MSGDSRGQRYALDVSEPLFRLATESVRLLSNDTRRLHTLDTLVSDRAAFVRNLDHNPETMRKHLDAVPSEGEIRIEFAVSREIAASLEEAKNALKSLIGSDVSLADMLSIMLFDFVVEQKANKVRAKLGLGKRSDPIAPSSLGRGRDGNVIRLK
jgi:hypothetical protein